MYTVSKRMEIAGAHRLDLDYGSKCSNLHGHNWIVTVHCRSAELDRNGMVADFKKTKDAVAGRLDHKLLNDEVDFNPTAENLARWIGSLVGPKCFRVDVQESEGNIATWEKD